MVFTDASDQAAAAVLSQEYTDEYSEVKEMPVVYFSAQFFMTHNSSGVLWLRKVMQFIMQSRNGDTILMMLTFCSKVMPDLLGNFTWQNRQSEISQMVP